jgi:PhnB protein
MRVNPYLNFDGRCDEAFAFYEKCLGGKVLMKMTFGESPMADKMPPELASKVLHISMALGDTILAGSDAPPDRYQKPQGFSVTLDIPDPAEADRVFGALAEQGEVQMPIQQTFWAKRFGMLVDRFGIPWMINCGAPA